MLTGVEPTRTRLHGNEREDRYIARGDPWGLLDSCPQGTERLCRIKLDAFRSMPVKLTGRAVGKPNKVLLEAPGEMKTIERFKQRREGESE